MYPQEPQKTELMYPQEPQKTWNCSTSKQTSTEKYSSDN